jgi:DNA topoisomerase III
MIVVITEKPSVAKDIASFLGAKNRLDGYFEGNGYQVTWAFGHLVTLKEPNEYDPALKKWSLSTLPFVPDSFQLKLISNPGVSKQYATIKRLLKASTEVIAATDAGREGELIFRYILSLAGLEKTPFKRLWLNSLTDDAIKKAFNALRPGSDYDNLYEAARCRSESDWIVGLNATRNFTVRYGRGDILWSVGRVQTPVLSMIAQREEEIVNFIPEPFWELRTEYRNVLFKWKGGRLKTEEKAKEYLDKIKDSLFKIQKVDSKEEKSLSPYLYDLTELQRDMNKKYGISANETLEIAQKLYESKAISYPRTDSKFLSSDMKGEIPGILNQLRKIKSEEISQLDLSKLPFTPRIINSAKVTDHHAIIPTGKVPSSFPPSSEKVFEAIVLRFIAAFYPPCLKNVTTVQGEAKKEVFQAKGVQVVSPGWTVLYAKEVDKKSKEEEQDLPEFILQEEGPHKPTIKQGKTEPPKSFTEGTLLGAMETAGKFVDDEQLKEALKQKGLGTPATRAAIIETLLRRGYIQREKKNVKVTDLGRYLIALIQDPNLKSPELTGEWEAKLKEMEQGRLTADAFMAEIVQYTRDLIKQSDLTHLDETKLGSCPLCKRPIIQGKKGFGCSGWKEGCSFVIWKEHKGSQLNLRQIQSLLQRKILLEPLNLSSGKVVLYLSDKGTVMEVPLPEGQKNQKKKSFTPRKKVGGSKKQ